MCGAGMNLDGSGADEGCSQQSAGARLPRHIPFMDPQHAIGCTAGAPSETHVSKGAAGERQSATIRVRINSRILPPVNLQGNTGRRGAQTRTLSPREKPGCIRDCDGRHDNPGCSSGL